MSSSNFTFKQFVVWHDRCAMKVGTDGVLLGAWQPCPSDFSPRRILDIGTGSGLIALMKAQLHAEAEIDGIDIDAGAYDQATYNFVQSPWSERLHAHQCPLQDWHPDYRYDLIVSNPPYFQNSLKNPDQGRLLARHTDSLPFAMLIGQATSLLAEGGRLMLIVPAEAEHELCTLAGDNGLSLRARMRVFTKEGKPQKRSMLCWENAETGELPMPENRDFYIQSAHSPRSEEYAEMCRDFYL